MSKSSFNQKHYEGAAPSTLCLGCGHDQVSKYLIAACFELQINPFQVAKISGIGCSSKTPNYFLKMAQGFNTIHGRMSSVATGVKIANSDLKVIGVSGDGDTGSIGLGSFLHTIRKNIPMIYLVENNGVYGLTKGQMSATAPDSCKNSASFPPLDLCSLALESGCGFVARSFSGDKKQLVNLLKLALKYDGFAFIDIISPCVAYGNHEDFSYSFSSMKKNQIPLNELDIIEEKDPASSEKDAQKILLPDGSHLQIKKLGEKQHDPTNWNQSFQLLKSHSNKKELITGLIHYQNQNSFLKQMNVTSSALVSLKEKEIRPSLQEFQKIMQEFI